MNDWKVWIVALIVLVVGGGVGYYLGQKPVGDLARQISDLDSQL